MIYPTKRPCLRNDKQHKISNCIHVLFTGFTRKNTAKNIEMDSGNIEDWENQDRILLNEIHLVYNESGRRCTLNRQKLSSKTDGLRRENTRVSCSDVFCFMYSFNVPEPFQPSPSHDHRYRYHPGFLQDLISPVFQQAHPHCPSHHSHLCCCHTFFI